MAEGGPVEPDLVGHDWPRRRPGRWRHLVLAVLLLVALTTIVAGLALTSRKVPRTEGTIVLVVDVSGSMVATDVAPDRITAAKAAAREFVSSLPPRLRVGLVSFSSIATVLAEPSRDRTEVLQDIDRLVASGGTAMGDALVEGVGLARPEAAGAEAAPAAVVLISDGANTVGHVGPEDAAHNAAGLGVPIYAISFGTPNGQALIPDGGGGQRLQTVPPDTETLRFVAELTDGELYLAPTAGDLHEVYDDIGQRFGYRTRPSTRWVLAAGVGLLVLALALSWAWRKKLRSAGGESGPPA